MHESRRRGFAGKQQVTWSAPYQAAWGGGGGGVGEGGGGRGGGGWPSLFWNLGNFLPIDRRHEHTSKQCLKNAHALPRGDNPGQAQCCNAPSNTLERAQTEEASRQVGMCVRIHRTVRGWWEGGHLELLAALGGVLLHQVTHGLVAGSSRLATIWVTASNGLTPLLGQLSTRPPALHDCFNKTGATLVIVPLRRLYLPAHVSSRCRPFVADL